MEYHGKGLCDTHFSVISQLYSSKSCEKSQVLIETTDDFIRLLRSGFEERSVNSKWKGSRDDTVYQNDGIFVTELQIAPQTFKNQQEVPNFTLYYSFFFLQNPLQIVGKLHSESLEKDQKRWNIESRYKSIAVEKTQKIGFQSVVPTGKIDPTLLGQAKKIQRRQNQLEDKKERGRIRNMALCQDTEEPKNRKRKGSKESGEETQFEEEVITLGHVNKRGRIIRPSSWIIDDIYGPDSFDPMEIDTPLPPL